jgi:hypothetical protein
MNVAGGDDDSSSSSDEDDEDDDDEEDDSQDQLDASQFNAPGDSDSDDDDPDEETLRAFDERLSKMFGKLKQQKRDQQENKQTAVNLRLRVLSLAEQYVRKRQLDDGTIDLMFPLYQAVRDSYGNRELEVVSKRAILVLQHACKVRAHIDEHSSVADFGRLHALFKLFAQDLLGHTVDSSTVIGEHEHEHEHEHEQDDADDNSGHDDKNDHEHDDDSKDNNKKQARSKPPTDSRHRPAAVAALAQSSILMILRVLLYHDKLDVAAIQPWLHKLESDFVTRRSCNLSLTSITTLLTRFPSLICRASLVTPLCEPASNEREFMRLTILQLLTSMARAVQQSLSSKPDAASSEKPLTKPEVLELFFTKQLQARFLSLFNDAGELQVKQARLHEVLLAFRTAMQTYLACADLKKVYNSLNKAERERERERD